MPRALSATPAALRPQRRLSRRGQPAHRAAAAVRACVRTYVYVCVHVSVCVGCVCVCVSSAARARAIVCVAGVVAADVVVLSPATANMGVAARVAAANANCVGGGGGENLSDVDDVDVRERERARGRLCLSRDQVDAYLLTTAEAAARKEIWRGVNKGAHTHWCIAAAVARELTGCVRRVPGGAG